jgi:hypothetical protein
MLTLMHPFLGFPLHLVGNNATPILCCISIPYVQQKVAIATILGMVAFEQVCRNVEFWLQIYLCDVATSWH